MVETEGQVAAAPERRMSSADLRTRRGSNLKISTGIGGEEDIQQGFAAREPATTSPKRLSRMSTTGSIAQDGAGGERRLRRRASTLFAPSKHELKVLHRFHGHSTAVSQDEELASPASAPLLKFQKSHTASGFDRLRKHTLPTVANEME